MTTVRSVDVCPARCSSSLRHPIHCSTSLSLPSPQIVHSEYETAASYFLPNCEQRSYGASCFHLGVLNAAERIAGASAAKAERYFERSCQLGNKEGCYMGGRAILEVADKVERAETALGTWWQSSHGEVGCPFASAPVPLAYLVCG